MMVYLLLMTLSGVAYAIYRLSSSVFPNRCARGMIAYLITGFCFVGAPLGYFVPATSFYGILWLTVTWPIWLTINWVPEAIIPYMFNI